MKSNHKLYNEDLEAFYPWLLANGYEANTEVVDWRVLMFRSQGQTQWTQCYTGLTAKAKVQRDFVRVFGPDIDAIQKFKEETKS